MKLEVVAPKFNDTEKREVNAEGNNSQIKPSNETHNETVKEEFFEAQRGGSTRESLDTNTNNKNRSKNIPAPKAATQQRRIAWWQHPIGVKAKNFQIALLLLRKILTNDDIKQEVHREQQDHRNSKTIFYSRITIQLKNSIMTYFLKR